MLAQHPLEDSYFLKRFDRHDIVLPLLLGAHVLIWTVYAVLSKSSALHPDMVEAYAWGREFQLGYYKHPPLWAWIAGAWFEVFPRSNWAFYLLSSLNSALGLYGVWRVIGLFTRGPFRTAATLLLLLTPFYTFLALRYNANTILLSLWPWTLYFFVRSMKKGSIKYAILFGASAAGVLLSKYYSGVLLVSCCAASFLHPEWKRYYKSAAPYVAVAACLALIAPHAWWLVEHDFPTLHYLETRTRYSSDTVHLSLVTFVLGCLALNLGVVAMIGLSKLLDTRKGVQEADETIISPALLGFAVVLAFGPFVLTVILGIFGKIRLSTNFAIPIFYFMPLLLAQLLEPAPRALLRRVSYMAIALVCVALFIAPAIPYLTLPQNRLAQLLVSEVSAQTIELWRKKTSRPIGVVGGTEPYDLAIAFSSGDRTSAFIKLDRKLSPWVTPDLIKRTGLLIVCLDIDEICNGRAATFTTPTTLTEKIAAQRSLGDAASPQARFAVYITPPE